MSFTLTKIRFTLTMFYIATKHRKIRKMFSKNRFTLKQTEPYYQLQGN
jgi:hypothetical protein